MLQTTKLDPFAGMSVADYAAAPHWYEQLLGSPPAFFSRNTEAVRELAEHRYLYIVQRPEHAGHARHTLFVDDLDTIIAQIADRGRDPALPETALHGVRKITRRDPDGNQSGFARDQNLYYPHRLPAIAPYERAVKPVGGNP
jgi:hypothetical protein